MPIGSDAAMDVSTLVQPPAKKYRRSTSDLIREQHLRQLCPTSVVAVPEQRSDALVAVPEQLALKYADPISLHVDPEERAVDSTKSFEAAARSRVRQLELAAALERRESMKPTKTEPILQSSEDLTSDLSIKTELRLASAHGSFRWLRRLPSALQCQTAEVARGAARDAILEMCKDCLPKLMTDPDKAVRWMERIADCLTWYQLEGPLFPTTALASNITPEERLAWRRVEEWDQAFRSLDTLLRQGLVSTFAIVSERFSVTVFGEGTGPWTSSRTGSMHRPTKSAPCAVLCPSVDEIRRMLQENHVSFEVADICASSSSTALQDGRELGTEIQRCNEECTVQAVTPSASMSLSSMEQIRSDLRELRRVGEKVVTPDEMNRVTPLSSALWFEGAWRVHALLDILRQYFLAAPLAASAPSPPRLPRLFAPKAFSHAAVQCAGVQKTQTVKASATNGASPDRIHHVAELSGVFFSGQVRRLLELLRVLLPSFECSLLADPRHCTGVNAFTQLGMHHVERVECECAGSNGTTSWKWQFKLAT